MRRLNGNALSTWSRVGVLLTGVGALLMATSGPATASLLTDRMTTISETTNTPIVTATYGAASRTLELPHLRKTFSIGTSGTGVQSRLLTAKLNFTQPFAVPLVVSTKILCKDPSGATIGAGYRGTNMINSSDVSVIENWLFTSDGPGTYTCYVYATSGRETGAATRPAGTRLVTVSAAGTYLKHSTNAEPNVAQQLSNPCDSAGSQSTCRYLHAGNPTGTALYGADTPSTLFYASPTSTKIEAVADVEVTACYQGDGACTGSPVSGAPLNYAHTSRVSAWMEVIEIASGRSCKTNATAAQTRDIRDDTHHYTFHFHQAFAINGCGFTASGYRFIVRVQFQWINGNPIKIEGATAVGHAANGILAGAT